MAARVPFDALGRAVPEPGQKEGTHGSTGPWGAVGRDMENYGAVKLAGGF